MHNFDSAFFFTENTRGVKRNILVDSIIGKLEEFSSKFSGDAGRMFIGLITKSRQIRWFLVQFEISKNTVSTIGMCYSLIQGGPRLRT